MPGEKWFGLNRTTVLLCSVLLDVSTGLRDAGFRATFVAFGSTPSFSEAVFLPFPPSVWSVLQTHAQSVHTLALTNNTKNSNIVTHVPSVSHVEQHLGAHKHIFFPHNRGVHSFLAASAERSYCWGAEGERERCLSALHQRLYGLESFWLSGIAMVTYCTFINSRGTLKLFLS